ncbi:MAG: KEOPS complex subunit Pcc1 [Candidatus Bathyarchaeia archaeon]
MKATVTIHYADASTARSIKAAVEADNRVAPKPLHITSRVKGKQVVSTITGAQDIDSLLATIDDLLLCLMAVDGLASTPKYGRPTARTKR